MKTSQMSNASHALKYTHTYIYSSPKSVHYPGAAGFSSFHLLVHFHYLCLYLSQNWFLQVQNHMETNPMTIMNLHWLQQK